ncbi:HAMP domain-containing histidine kinase [Lysinibacillus agricola]|uniref:histidine kinase n=1 Tax=Lysinibacillus agricola TaxID=2590012 RepID=A0ABX7AL96_9BACI|nr:MULTISPECIES: HAMP domain-containing sensor histidine kinase [Lysinibacillus]KOS59869.1 histidine kinase [Lysinibacillus sp. FJAT-14222]QQP10647.1 HAMP domain-containing histidine kinase [Lysinibacillus agricola]
MFHKTRKKLSYLYAALYFLLFSLFVIVLYFSLVKLMEHQQLNELEDFYVKQEHDFFEHVYADTKTLSYDPNRNFFYYIYTKDHTFVHGDESFKGLKKQVEKVFGNSNTNEELVKHYEWQEEHFLLLKKPIFNNDVVVGYIFVGKSVTSQHHFFQMAKYLLILLTCISTVLIGLLGYYMAGKAMIPIQWSFNKQKKFVSDASHELRTPLSIFYSSLEILEVEEAKQLSPFGKELIADLKDEAEIMKELIEKLLFLARHDQQQISIQKETIPLSTLLQKVSTKFQRIMPPEIQFSTEIQEDIELLGDASKIQELLYILLDNAIRYTNSGAITLALLKNKDSIKITVADSGVGMTEQELPLVFERFYRSDAARQRNGSGLGLAIAKAIVEQHNGKIYATSKVDKGTTFHIEFPI